MWYYQLNLNRNLGKTNPLTEADLSEFVTLQPEQKISENSWSIDVADLDENYDLSVKNPHKIEVEDTRTPQDIANEIERLNGESHRLLNEILELL